MIVTTVHPDDEALGCPALIATARQHGITTHVVSYTSGEASHPSSPSHTPGQLARHREDELHAALTILYPQATLELGHLPDGQLHAHVETITAHLTELVDAAARPTVLVAPFQQDGHSDHDTLGHIVQHVAAQRGTTLLEYPIWYWHWADPADPRWHQWQRVPDRPDLTWWVRDISSRAGNRVFDWYVNRPVSSALLAGHGSRCELDSPDDRAATIRRPSQYRVSSVDGAV